MMLIDCISDVHGTYPDLPGGDLLIIAGDLTARDTVPDWKEFYDWFEKQAYRKKVYIGGNHDGFLTQCLSSQEAKDLPVEEDFAEYLCDSGTEFEGLKIWGAPWTKWFRGVNPACTAFMLKSDAEMKKHWDLIPEDTDILITHTPPFGVLDKCWDGSRRAGCPELRLRLEKLNNLKLHVFGHLHESYGQTEIDGINFVNAAHNTLVYEPINPPIRVTL